MSLSLPWRRPKSSTFGHDHQLPRQLNELAIDDNEYDINDLAHGPAHQHHHFHAPGAIKGLIRRASLSINRIVHRRPSVAADDIHEYSARPRTSHAHNQSTWNKMRQATSFRHSRSILDLDVHHQQTTRDLSSEPCPHLPIPGFGNEPPVIPDNSGAAAKAAVAMQNEYYARQGPQNLWLYPTKSDEGNDRESGIGITVTLPGFGIDDGIGSEVSTEQASVISKVDFVSKLPAELAIHVLACLDAAVLTKASTVCHNWNNIIRNQHIWRESCLRETTTTYATSGPVMPNTGLGIPPITPTSDWKDIYRMKKELNHRWKAGKARPVYLNGHKDSIYCLQFDEYVWYICSDMPVANTLQAQNCHWLQGQDDPRLGYAHSGVQIHYRSCRDCQRV